MGGEEHGNAACSYGYHIGSSGVSGEGIVQKDDSKKEEKEGSLMEAGTHE